MRSLLGIWAAETSDVVHRLLDEQAVGIQPRLIWIMAGADG
jgi:hypothetical protein